MSKVAHYLQEHLSGEVMESPDARRYFATDSSIFSVVPSVVVYPRNENDVRKATRFTWQLAERGRVIPITCRGAGTDQSGAAIGSGVMMVFPAHMNRIIELDPKSGVVVVEPGINYGKLQQALHTHDRFLPPFPASYEYSTVGGAVANNAGGEKSVKYGVTRDYVKSLRVVLANGEVIETARLNKRELNKKLGLSTFEGEIYRAVDTLIEENKDLLKSVKLDVSKNSAGYALANVKRADGSFDLTPLFVGSQGTLGIISEITLETESYNPETVLFAAEFEDMKRCEQAVLALRALPTMPSAIEMVDGQLLQLVDNLNPNQLKDLVGKPYPAAVLLVEFDDLKENARKRLAKKASKILDEYARSFKQETEPEQQTKLWKIRHASALAVAHSNGQQKALPIVEDGIVPVARLEEYVARIYHLFAQQNLPVALWGHAGDGNLHMQPYLDLSQVGDRQKAFKLMDEYHNLVIGLGGSFSAEHGDGRLRGPYLPQLFGQDLYDLFVKVKHVFDPYGTLNPGVKIDVKMEEIRALIRSQYSLDHLYDHMPRS